MTAFKFLAVLAVGLTIAAPHVCADEGDDKVKELAAQLDSPRWQTRLKAAQELARMGPAAKAAVPALVQRVGDGKLGLLGLSPQPVDQSRIAALIALSKIAPEEVEPALRKAANGSPNLFVRAWANRQLAVMKKANP